MIQLTYVPFDGRIVFEGVDIHSENPSDECERKEYEGNPT
jgi:hypothetical protein